MNQIKKSAVSNSFDFEKAVKATDNEWILPDEDPRKTTTEWLDTGSLPLNAVISSSMFKGIPNNKCTIFEGMSGTGKTYICKSIARVAARLGYKILWFDTENAVDDVDFIRYGIPKGSFSILHVSLVEELTEQLLKFIGPYKEYYKSLDAKKRPAEYENRKKVMVFIDSIGNLDVKSEMDKMAKGNHSANMGDKAKKMKGFYTKITNTCGMLEIPVVATNHVSADPTAFVAGSTKSTGGQANIYNASAIVKMGKSKERSSDGTIVGISIKCVTEKNRFCRPWSKISMYLDFTAGLNRYYGLGDYIPSDWYVQHNIKKWELTCPEFDANGNTVVDGNGVVKRYLKDGQPVIAKSLYCEEMIGPMLVGLDSIIRGKFEFGSGQTTTEEDLMALDEEQAEQEQSDS
jgi:RecA/RadA recombinase